MMLRERGVKVGRGLGRAVGIGGQLPEWAFYRKVRYGEHRSGDQIAELPTYILIASLENDSDSILLQSYNFCLL